MKHKADLRKCIECKAWIGYREPCSKRCKVCQSKKNDKEQRNFIIRWKKKIIV